MEKVMKNDIKILFVSAVLLTATACQQSVDNTEIIDAARAGYAAFQEGDMEAWAETQSSNVEWIAPKSLPYAGTYYGPQEVMDKVFAPILELWPDFEVTDVNYKASGNTVFITTKIFAGGAESDSMHVATIEDGKYVKFQIYDDGGFMMQSAIQEISD
jgi:ketosteroid isomerase-like protein